MGRISGWHYDDRTNIETLIGKTLAKIEGGKPGDDEIILTTTEGERFGLYHSQDCCESVSIEDVIGDLSDLIGEPLLEAEEVSSDKDPEGYKPESDYRESFTWTFYKLRTRKGGVTLRWLGESNGYYSEGVDFIKLKPDNAPEEHRP